MKTDQNKVNQAIDSIQYYLDEGYNLDHALDLFEQDIPNLTDLERAEAVGEFC